MEKLDKRNIEDVLALTPMQEGMLFFYLKDPTSDYYFEQLSLEISGEIDGEIFQKAWNFVIETNEMLRTIFRWEKIEKPSQIILKRHQLQPIYYDFSGGDASETEKKLVEVKATDKKQKFGLREVPFRVTLCKVEEDKYVMIVSNHHILYDGWSNGIILKEFFNAYNDLFSGKELVKPVKTKFKEFVKWMNKRDADGQEKFWRNYLKGFDTQTELSIKRKKRREVPITGTEAYQMILENETKTELEGFVKKHKITLASLMYCAWGLLLQKYNNTNDVIFGTTVSGRAVNVQGIEDIVGLFINTIPLRAQTFSNEKIEDFLHRIHTAIQIRKESETTSLVSIREYSEIIHQKELFDTIIVIENYPLYSRLMLENSKLSVGSFKMVEMTHYDLTITISAVHHIDVTFEYKKELVDHQTIMRLSQHFKGILKAIMANPGKQISEIEIVSEEERQQILFVFNETHVAYPSAASPIQLFETQVEKTPGKAALASPSSSHQLTYRELNERSNHLGWLLREKGVGDNCIVGLMVERSVEMLVGILGIMKAGGAYLPIAVDYPPERVNYMMKDSQSPLLLARSNLSESFNFNGELIDIEVACSRGENSSPGIINNARDLVYMIYTSGSTGKPKGVMVKIEGFLNLLHWYIEEFKIGEEDNVLLIAPISFDLAQKNLFSPLLVGGCLTLASPGIPDYNELSDVIQKERITTINCAPSVFYPLVEFNCDSDFRKLTSLREVVLGGEPINVDKLLPWVNWEFYECEIVNTYGPTECTDIATSYRIPRKTFYRQKTIPIGKPLPNVKIFILDKYLKVLPVRIVGELYIGGIGLAKGYYNNSQLTEEKFLKIPALTERIVYRTGDLARWLPDGNIDFLGRIDHQVKVRGLRIELAEIEHELLMHEEIKNAVVTAKRSENGDNYLCGYIISGRELQVSELREYLGRQLPDYMIPTYFVHLDRIPLTPSGKVDRRALPKPEVTLGQDEYIAPQTTFEKKLVEICSEVLGIEKEKISINDNFFHLGGHSLKATLLAAKIHKELDVNVPLPQIFKTSSISGLAEFITHASGCKFDSIEPVEKKEYYPLSSAQNRLYFIQQMALNSTGYNMSAVFEIEGRLDKEKLERTFRQLITRHESLRTSFHLVNEEPVQRILEGNYKIQITNKDVPYGQILNAFGEDLAAEDTECTKKKPFEPKSQEIRTKSYIKNFIRPFDLSHAPLLRVGLIKTDEQKYILVVDMHHIISDGASTNVLAKDFVVLYRGEDPAALYIQYKDFSEWQNLNQRGETIKPQEEYWKTHFEGEIPVLKLPYDYLRPVVKDFEGSSLEFKIDKEETRALKTLAHREGATLYLVLLSIYTIFLSKLSSQEDIVVGTPTVGRRRADLEKIIGMFATTIVLRNYPLGAKTFKEYLGVVKDKTLSAFENQDYPYENLVEQLVVTRDTSRNPLFDTMFVMQNIDIPKIEAPGLKITPHQYKNETSKFDLALDGFELEEKLLFIFEYSTKLFKKETIERFTGYFKKTISSVLENPEKKVWQIEILPKSEKHRLLDEFNNPTRNSPKDKPLHRLFEEQVERIPDSIAVIGMRGGGGAGYSYVNASPTHPLPTGQDIRDIIQVTYGELNRKSNQLAHLMRDNGVKPDRIVGIMLERSLDMMIGLFAILKSGGAYLPIDTGDPKDRQEYFLKDSGATILLTDKNGTGRVEFKGNVIALDTLNIWGGESPNLVTVNTSKDLAYIIYTSGTTGYPKGVAVEHGNVVAYLNSFYQIIEITSRNVIVQQASYSFDTFVEEVYAIMLKGGRIAIPGKYEILDIQLLSGFVVKHQVDIINCSPLLLNELNKLDASIFKSVHTFISGGDILQGNYVDNLLGFGNVYNSYGPTEMTVCATFYRYSGEYKPKVPIGRPIANYKVYILDKYYQPVPVGVPGELCASGVGMTRGYLNKPGLTIDKFVPNPFAENERLFKTGDHAKWLPDGNIEFLGRIDHQVKLRGFRIEPEEIENRLMGHPEVKEALVMNREGEEDKKYLCAYVVTHSSEMLPVSALRDYLGRKLPDYMIPGYFVLLEKMPLSPSGKVDRKALPGPDPTAGRQYTPPGNKTEETLVSLWAEVLGLNKRHIGINDNFFELGGHSLRAAALIGRIHKAFSVKIPIVELFKRTTVKGISDYIVKTEKSLYSSIQPVEKKDYYQLSSAQKRLFVIYRMAPLKLTYNLSGIMILEGKLEEGRFEEAFKKLVNRHESLRTSFDIVDSEPVHRIHDEVNFEIEYYPLATGERSQTTDDRSDTHLSSVIRHLASEFIRPFDLSQATLLRVGLIKQGEEKHILMFDMHHIISDGVSMEIFTKEFMAFYKGETLLELRLQYKDFSLWQNRVLRSPAMGIEENYWLKTMREEIPILQLPTDYPRPSIKKSEGHRIFFDIRKEKVGQLKLLALGIGGTFFMVLLAIFNILLSKLCNQEDIIVGSPVAGRTHHDMENIIGTFINTLALRNYPSAEKRFSEFLAEVKESCLKAFENQDYQYEELVEKLVNHRDLSRNSLFDVMLVLQNMENRQVEIPGLKLIPYEYNHRTSKFDITLTAVEKVGDFDLSITYSTALFREETIRRFINYFKRIVSDVLEDSTQPIYRIDILAEEEKRRLVCGFNNTDRELPRDKTIHQAFAEQAECTPDQVALVGKNTNHKSQFTNKNLSITYKELNEKANQLAHGLRKKGILVTNVIGIIVDRSIRMMVGIFGILKAGGAYLPIDPDYPVERIQYILADSGANALVTTNTSAPGDRKLKSLEFKRNIEIIFIDSAEFSNLSSPHHPIVSSSCLSHPVYIIYTSGSTGKAKGVLLEHGNLVNYVYWFSREVGLIKKDRAVLTSSFGFDLGYTSVYPSLLSGCQLHILPVEIYLAPERFMGYMVKHEISYIKLTPSLFNTIVGSPAFSGKNCRSLRLVVLGGEEIKVKDVGKVFDVCSNIEVMNHYGPTEATIGSIAQFIDRNRFDAYAGRPTIGKPINNTVIYLVDKYLKLLPLGVAGEICISGGGLARGYLNRPELTAEKFVLAHRSWLIADRTVKEETADFPMSYQRSAISYIYRTGDLGRWLPDGSIEFLGRIDNQVKLRGYRIELGEIANHLIRIDEIKEAAVIVRKYANGDQYLCAYIVSFKNFTNAELKETLSTELPDYAIPSYFVHIDRVPLTGNGKINRRLLPEPRAVEREAEYVVPSNPTEMKMTDLWRELLGIEKIGVNDDFFASGGHSLKAIILASRIHRAFHVDVTLTEIFKMPTIRGLSEYISNRKEALYASIEPMEKKDYYDLSSAQKRLHFLHQMDENSTNYNMPWVMVLEGEVDRGKLEEVFFKLIRRHESLRTSFQFIKENPVQQVHREVDFEIEHHEVERTAHSIKRKEGHHASIVEDFIRPFALSQAPLLRVRLIKEYKKKFILMVDMHHSISDGVSRRILAKEFMALYAGEQLPPLKLQYKDYSRWQTGKKQRDARIEQERYWKKQLEGEIPVLELPTDYPRPRVQQLEGDTETFEVHQGELDALKSLAQERGTTLYMTLLAIYYIFLSKLSNQEDILIGTPTAGRRHTDLEQIIGMFVNTLVLRNYPTGEKTYEAFLKEIKDRSLQAFESQDYPFENLVEQVGGYRDISRNPLFDTMFVIQNTEVPKIEIPGLTLISYNYRSQTSKFDVTLFGVEVKKKLEFTFEYSVKLFKKNTIKRFVRYLKKVVSTIVKNPAVKISEVEIISEEEKKKVLFCFNDTQTTYPRDKVIHRLFEEQVERTPNSTAVVSKEEGGKGRRVESKKVFGGVHITYRELNEKSNQLAHWLRQKGVHPDTIVGIMVERSVEMILVILGILKAGGAYLPIEPDHPEERIKFMQADSSAKILVTTSSLFEDKKIGRWEDGKNLDVVFLSSSKLPSFLSSSLPPFPASHSSKLAYIIYTSGTTGRPKGVLIQHHNVVRLLFNDRFQFDFNNRDVWTLFHSYCFDFSVWEMYGALLYGGKLVVIPKITTKNPQQYLDILKQENVTILNQTPAAFYNLAHQELASPGKQLNLRYVIFGGEALSPVKLKRWKVKYPDTKLINMYGITETTVHVTFKELDHKDINLEISNIGKPIPTLNAYIMDKHLKLTPRGTAGECCVGGEGVGRGYLNQPELTRERFVENPYIPGEKLYRSGDLVKLADNDDMVHLGRIDHQVKIRGFRIELGEIETQLLEHEEVKEAVVTAKEDKGADRYLCAYLVLADPGSRKPFQATSLRDYLLKALPDYMIPSFFVPLDELPLTPNGKVDRKALPTPAKSTGESIVAPRDKIEQKLADIWAEVLSWNTPIGIDNNFFTSGGHSLKAALLVSRIEKAFNVKIPLVEIFKRPKIQALSQYIKEKEEEKYIRLEIEKAEEKEYYPLSSAQKLIYTALQLEIGSTSYNMVTILRLLGELDREHLQDTFRKLIERHESLRTSFEIIGNKTVQKVHDKVEFFIQYCGLGEGIAALRKYIRAFDLTRAPLLRVCLMRTGEREHAMMTDVSHIVSDGVSSWVLAKDFIALYNRQELPPINIRYKDFSEWENRLFSTEKIKEQEEFWLKEFEDEIPLLNMPTDYPRPDVRSVEAGDTISVALEEPSKGRIYDILRETGTTLFTFLLAVYNVLLNKYTGKEDIVVGAVVTGRTNADLEKVIGVFINMLPLRNRPQPEKRFRDFLEEVKENALHSFENQDYPLEELVKKLEIRTKPGRHPLFDTEFAVNNIEFEEIAIPGLKMERCDSVINFAKFDLHFLAIEHNNSLNILLRYSTELFKKNTAEKIVEHFVEITGQVMENPGIKLEDIEITIDFVPVKSYNLEKEQGDFNF